MAATTAEQPRSAARAETTPLISMRNIQKHFGSLHALRGASVEVHAGEVVGFAGLLGAGRVRRCGRRTRRRLASRSI